MGGRQKDSKEVRVLNKVIKHAENGIGPESDPRHAVLVVRQLGLEEAKPSGTPGVKQAKFS